MPKLFRSLVFRISSTILLMEVVFFTLFGLYYIQRYSHEIDAQICSKMQIPGNLMAEQALNYDSVRDEDAIERLIGEDVAQAMIIRPSGEIFYASHEELEGRKAHEALGETDLGFLDNYSPESSFQRVVRDDRTCIVSVTPLRANGKLIGHLFIEADTSRSAADKRSMAMSFILTSLICVCLTSITEIFLVIRLTGPRIRATIKCLHRVEKGDLEARLDSAEWSDELGELQQGVNAMIAEVQRRTEESQKAEQSLRESERRFRSMFDAMTEGVVLHEALFNDEGEIEDYVVLNVNEAFEKVVDVSREDLIGRRGSDLQPFGGKTFLALYRRVAATGCAVIAERYVENLDRYFTVSAFSPQDGQYAAVLQDITQRKKAEALEKAARAADAANEAKSQFLANMSHEIRTPLTAIKGFSEILRDEMLDSEVCESAKERENHQRNIGHLNTICSNSEHLLGLINDILDLSKIEAGKMMMERISFEPHRLIAEVDSLMKTRAAGKGLTLTVEYATAIPERVCSDPTRIRQILINLVGNAIKFTETGSIRIESRLVSPETGDPSMEIDVVDTGVGLTVEQENGLFEAFSQADASTTRKFGGTGLGLTISRRLAQALGGDVTLVCSEFGEGSRFRLAFATGPIDGVRLLENPEQEVADKASANSQTKDTDSSPLDCRLLFAEDGPDNQRLIAHVLKKAGADVTVVENGQLAVDAVLEAEKQGVPFEIVLTDMQMPVMDGYEEARTLREHGFVGPIIALTAHAMASDRQKCLDAGCDDFAAKPINRKELVETIRKHLPKGLGNKRDDVVEKFVDRLENHIQEIKAALAEDDIAVLTTRIRQLKTSAAEFSQTEIEEAATSAEENAGILRETRGIHDEIKVLIQICQKTISDSLPSADIYTNKNE